VCVDAGGVDVGSVDVGSADAGSADDESDGSADAESADAGSVDAGSADDESLPIVRREYRPSQSGEKGQIASLEDLLFVLSLHNHPASTEGP